MRIIKARICFFISITVTVFGGAAMAQTPYEQMRFLQKMDNYKYSTDEDVQRVVDILLNANQESNVRIKAADVLSFFATTHAHDQYVKKDVIEKISLRISEKKRTRKVGDITVMIRLVGDDPKAKAKAGDRLAGVFENSNENVETRLRAAVGLAELSEFTDYQIEVIEKELKTEANSDLQRGALLALRGVFEKGENLTRFLPKLKALVFEGDVAIRRLAAELAVKISPSPQTLRWEWVDRMNRTLAPWEKARAADAIEIFDRLRPAQDVSVCPQHDQLERTGFKVPDLESIILRIND